MIDAKQIDLVQKKALNIKNVLNGSLHVLNGTLRHAR